MPKTQATPRHAGLLWGVIGVLAFSVSLPMTRMAVAGGLPADFVGLGRALVAGLLAIPTLLVLRHPPPPARLIPRLALVATGVVFGYPILTALALVHVPATHGSVITGLLPAATAVMAVLRANERPSATFWLAATAGLGCVLAFAAVQGSGHFGPADALLLAAVLLCGLGYAEGGALARELGAVQVICLALVLSLPVTATATLLRLDIPPLLQATPQAWAGFAYLSLVSMFAGFFAWYRGLAQGGVARVGQLQLAQPVLSLLWSSLLLGETITPAMAITATAVLACVIATQRAR